MFYNHLKIAVRHFTRNKFYGTLNLLGLAVGLASCWLMLLFVHHELGFDRFFDKTDRLYQVSLSATMGEQSFETSNTPPPVGNAILEEFPEAQAFARLYAYADQVVKKERSSDSYTEADIFAVDSNFLEVFSFEMIEGDRITCLYNPGNVVITEEIAKKYFGDGPCLGKSLMFDDQPRNITGVIETPPSQSSLQFDFLIPMHESKAVTRFSWSWVWLQVDTYVLLKDPVSSSQLTEINQRFPELFKKHGAAAFRAIGQPLDEFYAKGGKWNFYLRPIQKVHLYSADIGGRITNLGNIQDIYVFSLVGLFILILACVNFMNLSTARALNRAKEVGVRKVLGSEGRLLMRQFFSESMIYSCAAAVIGLLIAQMTLPFFNHLTGESFRLTSVLTNWSGIVAISLPLIAGFLAGSYPAFYLTSIKPISALKGSMQSSIKGGSPMLRNGLVVFQFTIGVALVICTMLVMKQVSFLRNRPLGLQKENLLIVYNAQRLGNDIEAYRQQLLQQPQVISASHSTDAPSGDTFADGYVPDAEDNNPNVVKDIMLRSFLIDDDFVKTLDIGIEEGRSFAIHDFPSDSAGVLLNETAVERIGWKDPVGKWLTYPGGNGARFKVLGVMRDFNILSLRTAVEPFALFHKKSQSYDLGSSLFAVRLNPGEEKAALDQIERLWKSAVSGVPFEYSFLDEDFNRLYRSEAKLGSLLGSFTGIAMFIACLGLLGLVTYMVEQKTKEIGVRKVLGSSVGGIVRLLSWDFIKLVLIAFFIASPVAWLFMRKWLEDFAYRIDIDWWVFAVAGIVAIAIAFFTVSVQSVKAALANPVASLRSE